MALDSTIRGVVSGAGAEVDANNQLKVTLPASGLLAGMVRNSYLRDGAMSREMRISEEGEGYSAVSRLMFHADFNGATMLNNQFNSQATTMTGALTGGFLRLNSGSITTTNTGIAYQSARTFTRETGQTLRYKFKVRHNNGATPNKQCDIGTGMYVIAAAQAGASIEFVGFRWTQAGALLGVLEYSTGGVPTAITVSINGGVPFSDAVAREYEIAITDMGVEFWVNSTYQASIPMQVDASGLMKGGAYPLLMRLFITTAAVVAPTFDIGDVAVIKLGGEADVPMPYRQSAMGRFSAYQQSGLSGTAGNTATNVLSATTPTATTGSNTAAALTGLGGYYALNGASFATVNTNVMVTAYQNPIMVIASGAATDSRNLVITDLHLSAPVVTTTLVGGGFTAEWFVAIGNTAVSYATTDATGTTALGSKAPRFIPLSASDTLAAAATAGTVATRTGSSDFSFATPLVIHPSEFISVGYRINYLGAAVTGGVITGGVGFNGYWD